MQAVLDGQHMPSDEPQEDPADAVARDREENDRRQVGLPLLWWCCCWLRGHVIVVFPLTTCTCWLCSFQAQEEAAAREAERQRQLADQRRREEEAAAAAAQRRDAEAAAARAEVHAVCPPPLL